jgi:hypothetical protein
MAEISSDGGLGDRQLARLGAARGWRHGVGACQARDEAWVLEISVACACVARDDSVVATHTIGARGHGVDGRDVMR